MGFAGHATRRFGFAVLSLALVALAGAGCAKSEEGESAAAPMPEFAGVEPTPVVEATPEETAVPINEPESEQSRIEEPEPEEAAPSEEPEAGAETHPEGKLVLTIIESDEVRAKEEQP